MLLIDTQILIKLCFRGVVLYTDDADCYQLMILISLYRAQ